MAREKSWGLVFSSLVLGLLSFLDSVSWASSFPSNLVLRHLSLFSLPSTQTGRSPGSLCVSGAFHPWILDAYSLPLWVFGLLSNSRFQLSIQLSQVFYPTGATFLYHSCHGFDGLKPEDSIYLETQVFHVCLQVSSLKSSVFYFGPSIHYGPSTFCPSQVLDHLTGCPGIMNSSAMLILIAGALYLLGRG